MDMDPYKLNLASTYGIPIEQASTINVEKAHAYLKWLHGDEGRFQEYLYRLIMKNFKRDQKEWM